MDPPLVLVDISDESGPRIRTGSDAGFSNLAYLYNWPARFKILGNNKEVWSSASGEVVQKVEGRKKILGPDGHLDTDNSIDETLWESFKISSGYSSRMDMIQLVFHKQCHTVVELVLSASYHTTIEQAPRIPLHPHGNINGAEAKLLRQPLYFVPTLIRRLRISVNCLNQTPEYCWVASAEDDSGVYKNTWEQRT